MLLQLLKGLLRKAQPAHARATEPHAAPSVSNKTMALVAIDSARWTDAEALLRRCLCDAPDDAEAWHLLGTVLLQRGEPRAAVVALEDAVRLDGESAEARFSLGVAWGAAGEPARARAAFEAAVGRKPDFAAAWANLGSACKLVGDLTSARDALSRAVELEPRLAEGWHNLGSVLADMGRPMLRDAVAAFDRAIALDHPGVLESRFSRALACLGVGDLQRGWDEIDVRLRLHRWCHDVRPYGVPIWQGEPLAGRRVLVWSEQGVGDEVLHASMYADLIAQSEVCAIECRHKLIPLFQRSFPGAHLRPRRPVADPADAAGFDYQVPAGSLGRHVRPELESFPRRRGYLAADAVRVAAWRSRLDALGQGMKVGFSWRSGDMSGERSLACPPLPEWETLLSVPGIDFVCLQYGDCADEVERLKAAGCARVVRFAEVDYFDDLDEVAALMQALDLVVSAPTVVSVQAAALGVPTWQFAYGLDWQTHGTEANPWLPAMRRYERRWDQSWREVMRAPTHALAALAADGRRKLRQSPG